MANEESHQDLEHAKKLRELFCAKKAADRSRPTGTIHDQELMLHENGFGNHRTLNLQDGPSGALS